MAGILIYTAAPDSEGTLGGLASLSSPQIMQQHILKALHEAALCAGDPLCAENKPELEERSIHAAARHNCLFAPETNRKQKHPLGGLQQMNGDFPTYKPYP